VISAAYFFVQRSQVRDLRDQRFLDVGALFRRRQHVLLVITANPRQAQFDLRQHPDARQPVGRDVGRCLIYLVQLIDGIETKTPHQYNDSKKGNDQFSRNFQVIEPVHFASSRD